MNLRLVQRRTIWCPTLLGWSALLLLGCGLTALWCFQAEPFLSSTRPLPAQVLVVEGWIGLEGLQGARDEFVRGGYRHVVAAGGLNKSLWDSRRWNYAEEAAKKLAQLEIPPEKIIIARPDDAEDQRTYNSAVAVWRALHAAGLQPRTINIYTRSIHARRSRLIFAKVFQPDTEVGVVSWVPADFAAKPWWRSSERAEDLVKETVGYLFELLLNSGRSSNSPSAGPLQPRERNP